LGFFLVHLAVNLITVAIVKCSLIELTTHKHLVASLIVPLITSFKLINPEPLFPGATYPANLVEFSTIAALLAILISALIILGLELIILDALKSSVDPATGLFFSECLIALLADGSCLIVLSANDSSLTTILINAFRLTALLTILVNGSCVATLCSATTLANGSGLATVIYDLAAILTAELIRVVIPWDAISNITVNWASCSHITRSRFLRAN
jgi:hypothetical protein